MATIEVRKLPDGTVSFRAKVRLKGHPPQTATFSRRTDAKRWAQSTEAAIREGRYFNTQEGRRHTVTEMIDRYVREVLPHKPRNAKNIALHLRWWKEQLGPRLLADVTPAAIVECRSRLLSTPYLRGKSEAKRSPTTVKRYLASLSHVYSIALREWHWVGDSPLRKVTKPKEPRGRVRFLDDAERERLLATCERSSNPHLYAIVVLALSTGMRLSEIRWLRWRDVDVPRGWITLEDTKNGERRGLPLSGHAADLIRKRSSIRPADSAGTVLLFPGAKVDRPVEITKAWRKALAAAEIENFRFHDLRHSAASYLAMNGASSIEIARVLGHKTLQMVKRYAHLSDEHSRTIVSSMNAKIFAKEAPDANSAA